MPHPFTARPDEGRQRGPTPSRPCESRADFLSLWLTIPIVAYQQMTARSMKFQANSLTRKGGEPQDWGFAIGSTRRREGQPQTARAGRSPEHQQHAVARRPLEATVELPLGPGRDARPDLHQLPAAWSAAHRPAALSIANRPAPAVDHQAQAAHRAVHHPARLPHRLFVRVAQLDRDRVPAAPDRRPPIVGGAVLKDQRASAAGASSSAGGLGGPAPPHRRPTDYKRQTRRSQADDQERPLPHSGNRSAPPSGNCHIEVSSRQRHGSDAAASPSGQRAAPKSRSRAAAVQIVGSAAISRQPIAKCRSAYTMSPKQLRQLWEIVGEMGRRADLCRRP